MKKFLLAICTAMLCTVAAICAACGGGGGAKPEKLKDGTALTLTEGERQNINLAEYISLPENYRYEVNSSGEEYVTVQLNGSTATVTAVKKGNATVTASAGDVSVEFAITVNEENRLPEEKPAPVFDDITVEYDLKDEDGKTLTLAPKSGSDAFVYSYALKEADASVTVSGNKLTVAYEEAAQKQLIIVATYTDGENPSLGAKTVEFKLNVTVTDTRDHSDPTEIYKVKNGGFDNDLIGWTMEGDIGEISEKDTFWEQKFPVFNDGKYFSGEAKESAEGTLASSLFVVGGVNKISFKLGAAGNSECYITLEKADGTVLAIWRNTKFADVGGWKEEEIGKTQFACNMVTYVADLADFAGAKVRVVLHDYASGGYGFFNFDSLVTYYAEESEVPAGVTAENQLADKTALKAVLDGVLTEQGDYTAESFAAYTERVAVAQKIYNKLSATQLQVDSAKTDVETAFKALALRVPEEKADAEKAFSLLVGKSKQLNISDYVDGKNLSSLTYSVQAADGKVTVSAITDGKFTVTAGADEGETSIIITVKYKDNNALTVTLTVTVTSETAPRLKHTEVTKELDLYSADNKTNITVDFADNVENVGGLALTYTVTLDGGAVSLNGTSYTYVFGNNYSETATEVVFTVKIAYTANEENDELVYAYKLKITDTSAYRITNGTFDDGLTGWTLSNPKLGAVSNETHYWLNDTESAEGFPFYNDGNFFSAYANGEEAAMGTLTSSPFTIGGSGYITFKLGGARNADKVFLDIIEKDTGAILARYHNSLWQERTDGVKSGCKLSAYKANLSAYKGKTVYIRISDNGVRDYGLFFADSFVTYYPEVPADGNAAVAVTDKPDNIYQVYNGGFETGNLSGWELVEGEHFGAVSNDEKYFSGASYGKDGDYLFTGANAGEHGTNGEWEAKTGVLRSNSVVIKAGATLSFKLGGGNKPEVGIRVVKFVENNEGVAEKVVVASYTNVNQAGGTEAVLNSYSYQLTDITDETDCYIEIFDNAEGGWGLVTVDGIAITYAE